ncbi:MAG: hypothetical protein HZA53_07095 [Planctomycetes bacterium]|nr:hypothetical protein [Planctomycetota bacterium]
MIGKLVFGGIAACVAGGAYLGWRLARADPEPAPESRAPGAVFAAADGPGESKDVERASAPIAAPRALELPSDSGVRIALAAPLVAVEAAEGPVSAPPSGSPASEPAEFAEEGARPPTAAEIPALVDALRDDDVRGNALHAFDRLTSAKADAVAALERALGSRDEQQRALAACALVSIGGHSRSAELAHALLAILTPRPGERFHAISARDWHCSVGRANVDERWAAFRGLESEPELFASVEDELSARLSSADAVLRFDAARIVLAHAGARARRQAIDVLVLHLADNALDDDAAIAMRRLGELGGEALPSVLLALPGRDEQSAKLLGHLLAYVEPSHHAARKLAPKELVRMGFHAGDMLAAR